MTTNTPPPTTNVASPFNLDLLRWIVIAAMVSALIYLVASLVAVFTSDSLASPLELSLSTDAITSPYPASSSIADATALVDVETGLGFRVAWWLVTDALAIVGIGFLELLRRLLANRTKLFTDQNAARLRWMVVLAIFFAVVGLIRPAVSFIIQDNSGFDGLEAAWDTTAVAGALILAALLEVWRHGVTLQVDRDLTV